MLCFYCTSTKPNRARKVPRAESQVDRRAIIPAALQAPTTPSRFRLGDDRKGIFACRGLLGTARGPTTTWKASTSWCWFVHLTVTERRPPHGLGSGDSPTRSWIRRTAGEGHARHGLARQIDGWRCDSSRRGGDRAHLRSADLPSPWSLPGPAAAGPVPSDALPRAS